MQPYDDGLRYILENGVRKENRTGVDTLAVFGMQSRYRIDEKFPLITGRKVWPKSIFAELLWLISGSTNNKKLQELGSNIWTPWVDKEFEDKYHFEEGSLGPIYGFQLRHFGGNYNKGIEDESQVGAYGYGGFDQLEYMLDLLKNDPNSRRILFSLWNPLQLSEMKLAPCHYTFQFFVHENKLSGMLSQRSADFPIGTPANVQFYSAFIYMMAQQVGLEPYEFIHSTADSHIYVNQIDAVEEYLSRSKPDSPSLELEKANDIDSYSLDHFKIKDYEPQEKIKIPVAV